MMLSVIGIDPGAKELGYARVLPGVWAGGKGPPIVRELGFRRTSGEARIRDGIAFLLELGRRADPTHRVVWAVEAAPKKLKRAQHGSHVTGAGPERWRTVARVVAFVLGHEFVEVGISPWRRTMTRLDAVWARAGRAPEPAARFTMPAPASRRRGCHVSTTERLPGAMVRVVFECGHRDERASVALIGAPHVQCPRCTAAKASAARAEDQREAWKRQACEWVARHFPEPYAGLVEGPRARARSAKGDHLLVGVPDACEALGVACHALGEVLDG